MSDFVLKKYHIIYNLILKIFWVQLNASVDIALILKVYFFPQILLQGDF